MIQGGICGKMLLWILYIFPREQKCMHLVLDLENLNPFSLAYSFTLFKFCWSCRSTMFT